VFELREEPLELLVGKVSVVGVVGVGFRGRIEYLFDLIDLDCLPEVFELRNVDVF
jgi:hypothetical protein